MKHQTKWLAVVAAVASGLMVANSLEAQNITGGTYLSNVLPNTTSPNAEYNNMTTAAFSDVATGLTINQSTGNGGYEGAFYYVLPNNQIQNFSASDTEVVITFTVNGTAANYNWVNSQVILNDINGGTGTYGAYSGSGNPGNPTTVTWNGNVCTQTFPLNSTQLANVATGADHIYAFTYTFDPAAMLPGGNEGPYDITLNSIALAAPGGSSSSPIQITAVSYNPSTQQVTLTWSSSSGAQYTILYTGTLPASWSPLQTNIASGGTTTTQTFSVVGASGYFKIQQQ